MSPQVTVGELIAVAGAVCLLGEKRRVLGLGLLGLILMDHVVDEDHGLSALFRRVDCVYDRTN